MIFYYSELFKELIQIEFELVEKFIVRKASKK